MFLLTEIGDFYRRFTGGLADESDQKPASKANILLSLEVITKWMRDFYRRFTGGQADESDQKLASRADTLLSQDVRTKWEREQEDLKKKVLLEDAEALKQMVQEADSGSILGIDHGCFYVAGVDISFVKNDDVNACAAFVVLSYPQLKTVYNDCKMIQLTAPYIPGFLGFREAPFILDLFEKLKKEHPEYMPQVVLVDGNGILHPKEFGSACHLGVSMDLPCIGVAKKLFHVDGLEKDQDHHKKIEALQKGGDTFPLITHSGKTLGMALRSCNSTKNPVYVSPGHKVTMDTAVRLVHNCCKHRVPEPVRLADINSREYLRQNFKAAVKVNA